MNAYQDPPLVPHAVANTVLSAVSAGHQPEHEPNSVLVGLALYDEDRAFVEAWCHRIAEENRDLALVGTAALSLGHLARRFRGLQPESVALVHQLAERPDLDGRVFDALEDVTQFLTEEQS